MSIPKIGIAGNQWITEYLINKLISVDLKPSLIINMDNTWEDKISGYINLGDKFQDKKIKTSLISRGIGVGNQLEYIDEITLGKSIVNRSPYEINFSS